MSALLYPIKGKITVLKDYILGMNLEFGEQKTNKGIILLNDDQKEFGIKPRWIQIFKVGPNILDIKPGQFALCDHGEWSAKSFYLQENLNQEPILVRYVKYEGILLVTDEKPYEYKGL